jgi:two-component system chemotaxis response regulator CheB
MPESALRNVNVDRVVPVGELAPLLVRLTSRVSEVETVAVPEKLEIEVNVAKEKNPIDSGLLTIGNPSRYACPECHGVLLEIKEAGRLRFVVTRVMRFRPRASSPRSATAPKRRCGTRSVRSKKRGC